MFSYIFCEFSGLHERIDVLATHSVAKCSPAVSKMTQTNNWFNVYRVPTTRLPIAKQSARIALYYRGTYGLYLGQVAYYTCHLYHDNL